MNENKEKHRIYKIYKHLLKKIKDYKIKRETIESKKGEYPYNDYNNYGFSKLMPINKKMSKLIQEIKYYYTTSYKDHKLKYYNCKYLKNKLSKISKTVLNINLFKDIILQKKLIQKNLIQKKPFKKI